MNEIEKAIHCLTVYNEKFPSTKEIAEIEKNLCNRNVLKDFCAQEDALKIAVLIKKFSSNIHVVIHSLGILTLLPEILEKDETIVSLSLGAGNTGRDFDLETTGRVAEFKFVQWRGGAESIRQNNIFADFFKLVSCDTQKKKELYVVGDIPVDFLKKSKRKITSVFSKDQKIGEEFKKMYKDKNYEKVCDYYKDFKDVVKIKDINDLTDVFKMCEDKNI
ncbi:MAG TPA: hypothetical protein PL056_14055 [bacterium]|nr:hypothetical protein [bacterium]